MKCIKCTKPSDKSTFNHFIDLSNKVGRPCFIIVKDVPCYVCTECGERFVDGETLERLEEITDRVRNALCTEVAVLNYTDSVVA